MSIAETKAYRAALDALPERDKKILSCARRAVNALGFALQNAHNENAVCRREQESGAAMNELTDLLLSNPFSPEAPDADRPAAVPVSGPDIGSQGLQAQSPGTYAGSQEEMEQDQ